MKNNLPRPSKIPDPLTLPSLPPVPIPISFGTLDIQSLLRDLLEDRLRPTVLRKL
jgi:hypothetical protein